MDSTRTKNLGIFAGIEFTVWTGSRQYRLDWPDFYHCPAVTLDSLWSKAKRRSFHSSCLLQRRFENAIFARLLSNFFLTSIPEEGFYRGFIQNTFYKYFENIKFGKILALLVTSILFTAAHVYWSPNAQILGFVFLASLLYGGVYLISGKLESAILCHFLLNLIHMMFFSYHAM